MRNKVGMFLLDTGLAFTAMFTVVLWFWFLYPYKPLEIVEPLIIQNENKQVVAGEDLYYTAEFKKNTNARATIYRRLVDGVVYHFPPVHPQHSRGESESHIFVNIPRSIPEGEYTLISVSCYHVNPIREVCVEFSTEKFNVIK